MPIFGSKEWYAEGKTVVGEEEEGIAKAEYLGYTPHLYKEYYPEGYSACVRDQKCRGNNDAYGACEKLLSGDPSEIITVAKYKGGAVSSVLSGCPAVFRETKLGSKMAAMSLDAPALITAVKGATTEGYDWNVDPYRSTGGVGTNDTSSLVSRVRLPSMPSLPKFGGVGGWLSLKTKAILGLIGVIVLVLVFMIALGYSGLGGSVGSHLEK